MCVLVFQMFKFRTKKKTITQIIQIIQITRNRLVLKEFENLFILYYSKLHKFFSLLNLIMSKFFVNDSDDEENRP